MSMIEWAKEEVKIACKKESSEYGRACYASALKAFESLCNDGHSGMSYCCTRNILKRLLDEKPLTPIEDTPDIWIQLNEEGDSFQCKRLNSLFKDIGPDGAVTYNDISRVDCCNADIYKTGVFYNRFLAERAEKIIGPIEFPYCPSTTPYKIYVRDYLIDKKNGDFDTYWISHLLYPNGKKVTIDEWWTLDPDDSSKWTQVDADYINDHIKEIASNMLGKE